MMMSFLTVSLREWSNKNYMYFAHAEWPAVKNKRFDNCKMVLLFKRCLSISLCLPLEKRMPCVAMHFAEHGLQITQKQSVRWASKRAAASPPVALSWLHAGRAKHFRTHTRLHTQNKAAIATHNGITEKYFRKLTEHAHHATKAIEHTHGPHAKRPD